ncbi:MAG: hypothetical protein DRJ61_08770 [Acidobacteria bacterium]|nr:MAG: hypothetical protein DRJ61_08770 [Acidobacteriota bacterium]
MDWHDSCVYGYRIDKEVLPMRRQKGFTLIELLIVVAIIGIIAAIAIPNLLNAINRGRQKRTMADMRTISTAMGAYGTDNVFYPIVTDMALLGRYITPVYIKTFPLKDGWGTPYDLNSASDGSEYTLISYGKDREGEGSYPDVDTKTKNFDCDIVANSGSFIQYPEGTQTE